MIEDDLTTEVAQIRGQSGSNRARAAGGNGPASCMAGGGQN